MGILDFVFAKETGLVNKLVSLFGCEITVVLVEGTEYDEVTDSTIEFSTSITATAVCPSLKDIASPMGDMFIEQGANTVFDVPACQFEAKPEARKTRVLYNRRSLNVLGVEEISSGSLPVLYRLYCRK